MCASQKKLETFAVKPIHVITSGVKLYGLKIGEIRSLANIYINVCTRIS